MASRAMTVLPSFLAGVVAVGQDAIDRFPHLLVDPRLALLLARRLVSSLRGLRTVGVGVRATALGPHRARRPLDDLRPPERLATIPVDQTVDPDRRDRMTDHPLDPTGIDPGVDDTPSLDSVAGDVHRIAEDRPVAGGRNDAVRDVGLDDVPLGDEGVVAGGDLVAHALVRREVRDQRIDA